MVPGRHSLIWQTSKFNTEPEGPPLQIMAKIMAGDGTVPTLTCKILPTFILELPTRFVCQMAIVVPCCAQLDGVVMIYTVWTDTSNECPFLKSWVNNQQSPTQDKKWEDMINTPSKPYSNFMMGLLLILGPWKKAHSYPLIRKEIPPGVQDFPCTMDPLN